MSPSDREFMQEADRQYRNETLDRLEEEQAWRLPRELRNPDYGKTQHQIDTERAIDEGALDEGLERGGSAKTRGGRGFDPDLDR